MQLTEKEKDILQRFEKYIYTNRVSKEFLVQYIELIGDYLGLKTIPDYSKENNISYNGVKKFRLIRKIFNIKFVIDN